MRRAFTLIELLVVIAIIGLLIGMSIPAAQMVREASRNTTCKNNLRQVGIGIINYESTYGHYPSGKYGWLVMTLDFLELQDSVPEFSEWSTAPAPSNFQVFTCPSDGGISKVDQFSRVNYLGNAGIWLKPTGFVGIFTYDKDLAVIPETRDVVRTSDVRDGLSNTALCSEALRANGSFDRLRTVWQTPGSPYGIGEFHLLMQAHATIPQSDPQSFGWVGDPNAKGTFYIQGTGVFHGMISTMYNHAALPNTPSCFNSASYPTAISTSTSQHSASVNTLTCDGAVRPYSSSVDLSVWRALGDRNSTAF